MEFIPPHNIEIESLIISCLLNENKEISLKKEDFYSEKYQIIYSAITRLKTNDIAIIADQLEKTNQLKKIGGRKYLMEISNLIYSPTNLPKYVKEVKKNSTLRKLQEKLYHINEENLDDNKKEIEKIFEEYQKLDNKDLESYNEEDKIVLSHDRWEEIQKEPELPKIKSLIPSLDKKFECFEGGEMIIISGPEKSGKCFGKGTEILMYDGSIKKVEDIKIGDKLMGNDSEPRNVLNLGSGVEMMYKITNRDNGFFICNESHILSLMRSRSSKYRYDNKFKKRQKRKDRKGEIKNINIKDYINSSNTVKNLYKAHKTGVKFKRRNLIIEPYFLGLWLGDGTTSNTGITTMDKEIVNYLKYYAKKLELKITINVHKNNKSNTYSLTRDKKFKSINKCKKGRYIYENKKVKYGGYGNIQSMKEKLCKYNLINNKHIPDVYKINSQKNRLKLLAGLIDSDGCKSGKTSISYCTKIEQLRDDVIFLARSLGFYAASKKPKIINGKEYYRVYISGDLKKIPLLLKRKMPEVKNFKNVLTQNFKVEKLKKGKYYGFEIDGNNLFLLADFTVAHNTSFAQTLTLNFSNQNITSLWFTYEMREKAIFKKMPKDIHGNIPTFVLPKILKNDDISWIEERIVESILKYQIQVVFIDHLGFIVDAEKNKDKRLEVDSIIRKIKTISLKYNLLIFPIHHIKKIEPWTIPTKDHLKETSAVSQDSDGVIMIWRDFEKQKYNQYEMTGKTICAIEHSRRSGAFKERIYLQYDNLTKQFKELEQREYDGEVPYYNKEK